MPIPEYGNHLPTENIFLFLVWETCIWETTPYKETPACTVELSGETLAYSASGKHLPFHTLEYTQTTRKKQF